jgi:hypothetical protein
MDEFDGLELYSFNGLSTPVIVGIAIALFVLFIVVSAIPAILAFVVLKRIPIAQRKLNPGMAFLLMIPLFSVIWAFFVHPKVAESIRDYYQSQGDDRHGDCGATLAVWHCILAVGAMVPLVGLFMAIGSSVLISLFYVKAFKLTKYI